MQGFRLYFLRFSCYNSGMEENRTAEKKGLPKGPLSEAGITYSLAILLFIIVSFAFSAIAGASVKGYQNTDWYRYLSYLLPQLCFAATVLIYFRRNREFSPVRKVYQGCKWHYYLLAIALAFGLFSLSELNGYFVRLLELLGYQRTESTLPTITGWYLVPAILVIALLPAFFEETIFRGILSGTMRKSGWGTLPVIFTTGALFSLFHGNPEQTLYQFACGVCYSFVAMRSGSPFPTMLAHFLNNAVILVLTAFGMEPATLAAKLAFYIPAGVCLVGVIVYLAVFDKGNRQKGGVIEGKKFFFTASVGIIVAFVEWLAVLIQGFIHG